MSYERKMAGVSRQKYSGWMSVDARDSRRIKTATDKFLKRDRKKPEDFSSMGRKDRRWLVTPRSISLPLDSAPPRRLHVHAAPRTRKFIKTGSFNRAAHYAVAENFSSGNAITFFTPSPRGPRAKRVF